jgi:hypothetical protein
MVSFLLLPCQAACYKLCWGKIKIAFFYMRGFKIGSSKILGSLPLRLPGTKETF